MLRALLLLLRNMARAQTKGKYWMLPTGCKKMPQDCRPPSLLLVVFDAKSGTATRSTAPPAHQHS